MAELQAQPVADGRLASITNGESEVQDDRDSSPHGDEGAHRDGTETPDPPRQKGLGGASQGGQSNASVIDATIEIAQNASDTEWLEQCLANGPIRLRAKIIYSTAEQLGLDIDWNVAGEGAWSSCQQVANAAIAHNNPRMEAADVWVAANFDCEQGSRDYGAARPSTASAAPMLSVNTPHRKAHQPEPNWPSPNRECTRGPSILG